MDRPLVIALIVALAAICALPAMAQQNHAAVAERVRMDVLQPGYATASDASKKLRETIDAFCSAGGDQADVQAAFQGTMDAWQAVQHVRSGPVAAEDRHARLQFWPDKRGNVGKHLRRFLTTATDADLTGIADQSVAVQGFPALERLVFSGDGLMPSPAQGQSVSTCAVASAISANIAGVLNGLASASNNPDVRDPAVVVRDRMMDLVTGLEAITRLKISAPMGTKRPLPKLSENWRSNRSARNIAINLRALKSHYDALMTTSDQSASIHPRIVADFDAAIAKADALGDSLVKVLESDDGPKKLTSLAFSIDTLRGNVTRHVTAQLGLDLGFNSLDGD